MTTQLGALDLEDAANEAAGNWQRFNCFVWYRDDIADKDSWCIVYTHYRDSGLLDQSNASVIRKSMMTNTEGDDPDVVSESHHHWAVGHVNGISIRVFDKRGRITEAFRVYHELAERIDNYLILDENDYSEREYEATLENIANAAWRLKDEFDLPNGWVGMSTRGSPTTTKEPSKTETTKAAIPMRAHSKLHLLHSDFQKRHRLAFNLYPPKPE